MSSSLYIQGGEASDPARFPGTPSATSVMLFRNAKGHAYGNKRYRLLFSGILRSKRVTMSVQQSGATKISPTPSAAQQQVPTTSDLMYPRVFLDSCPEDHRYVQRLLVHFRGHPEASSLAPWHFSLLPPGSLWQQERIAALEAARVVVLLISGDFLASPFIAEREIPLLLHAAESGRKHILPVLLTPCLFEESPLSRLQTVNDRAKPLSLLPCSAREIFWVSLVRLCAWYLIQESGERA